MHARRRGGQRSTAKEFDLLAFLAADPGAVRSRTEILEHVWDAHWYGPTKTVDAHVAAVRKKLGDPRWIEAVRGVGLPVRATGPYEVAAASRSSVGHRRRSCCSPTTSRSPATCAASSVTG